MAESKGFWNTGFGSFLNNMLLGLPSLVGSWISSSRLTGAEREQNKFNAQQAAAQREFESDQAQRAMDFSAAQTQQQMDFQREMANTQWQRGVQDMQAAGLNPALAYSQGGAVAPSGAAASGVAGSGSAASGSGRGMPFSMSEIMQLMLLPEQKKLLDAQALKTEKEGQKLDKDLAWYDQLQTANVNQITAATRLAQSEYRLNENERKALLAAEKVATDNKSALESAELFFQEWKNAFVQDTGMDPTASVLGQLFQNAITNLGQMLEKLFPKDFHFTFTNLTWPFAKD